MITGCTTITTVVVQKINAKVMLNRCIKKCAVDEFHSGYVEWYYTGLIYRKTHKEYCVTYCYDTYCTCKKEEECYGEMCKNYCQNKEVWDKIKDEVLKRDGYPCVGC